MIAEQYRNISPHFAYEDDMPLAIRWSCILWDQDTENPPFEPARYFVVNVFAGTKDAVLNCLGEEYPWCDIMYVDKALGGHTDDDFLESWLHHFDAREAIPVREAPHGRENLKKYTVRETIKKHEYYYVYANNPDEAIEKHKDSYENSDCFDAVYADTLNVEVLGDNDDK